MFSAIWAIFTTLAGAFFQLLDALAQGLFAVVSTVASAVLLPVRVALGLLSGHWDFFPQWPPLYFVACGVLLAALLFILFLALWSNHKRKKGQ